MSANTDLSPLIESLLKGYMKNYGIERISVRPILNFRNDHEISDITLDNRLVIKDEEQTYRVRFKLQEEGSDLYQYLRAIDSQPELQLEWTDLGLEQELSVRDKLIESFMALTKTRVEKARQEQEVQSIPFVGNTFVLNKSTTFRVLADDGDGRLDIEILSGEGLQEAMLSAHGLLDGLYTGFIQVAKAR